MIRKDQENAWKKEIPGDTMTNVVKQSVCKSSYWPLPIQICIDITWQILCSLTQPASGEVHKSISVRSVNFEKLAS